MSKSFSAKLSELRKKKGISQRGASSDLHISQALLSHYENGAREPGLGFVCRACEYYGVSADYLLGRSDEKGVATPFGSGKYEAAWACLKTVLSTDESKELEYAAERYLTAAVYKVLLHLQLESSACYNNEQALDIERIIAEGNIKKAIPEDFEVKPYSKDVQKGMSEIKRRLEESLDLS